MSASPAVPGVTTIPGTDQAPTGPEPTGDVVEEPPERRRRKILLLLLLGGVLVLLLGLAIWYLLFRQPIPLPTIPGETIMPSYVTAMYGTDRPMGVATNAAGDRIYVGETAGDHTARVLDGQGNELAKMLPPTSTGTEHVPVYLAVSPLTAEVYVSDRPTGAIYIYDASGVYQRSFTPVLDVKGWQPLGLAFDAAGNLYVTDVGDSPQRIRVFDPAGKEIRTLGADASLDFPNGIAVDAAGDVYVSDSNNGRLLVFGPEGTVVAQVGRGVGEGNLGLPRGLAVDGENRLYIADSTGQRVLVYGTYKPGEGQLAFLGSFGAEGTVNGAFEYPNAIAVDGRGRLYIADSINDRVQLWSY